MIRADRAARRGVVADVDRHNLGAAACLPVLRAPATEFSTTQP
ncbi:hypothetical protein I546_3707 [Mycobacterium kansasii 732]|nr:hypothetical protein I546_3707 [Mycobacterium kansasii 732]